MNSGRSALLLSVPLLLMACTVGMRGGPVDVAKISPQEWANLSLKGEVTSVSIKGQPVVNFKLTDRTGRPVIGLGSIMKRATDQLASYPNLAFTLAKLVPGRNGSPSQWVNYMVTTIPTVAVPNPTVGRFPSTDNVGKLVDNGDGTYQYTFYRDVTKVKDIIAATIDTEKYNKADLGDLTFDPNLTHRVAFQVSGAAPGTGTNVLDGVQKVAGVNIIDPLNVTYDFIPATGKSVVDSAKMGDAAYHRDILTTEQCNACHGKLGSKGTFHGKTRYEVKYCVACHTDQVKTGSVEATRTPDGKGFIGTTDKIDNRSPGEFTIMIHKIHMGSKLTLQDYNWLNRREGQFNKNGFPQSPANCLTCHVKDSKLAAQADNWKTQPSRTACGACHDGINFATDKGIKAHAEGVQLDDSKCATCHEPADIASAHKIKLP